jgi:hypothetical protein
MACVGHYHAVIQGPLWSTEWLCGGGTIFTIHSHYREYLLRMCAGARPPEPQLAGLSLSALFSLGT